MSKTLKAIIKGIWAVSAIALATTIGAIYGWQQHGWTGAIALGFVGLCVGVFIAVSPQLFFQFLS